MPTATPAKNATTDELRRYFKITRKTPRHRKGRDMNAAVLDVIRTEFNYPGCYSGDFASALKAASPILHAWDKFVSGYRLPGTTHYALTNLKPWALTALIGRMIDAGITNNYQAECWFRENRVEIEGWAPMCAIEEIRANG